jgi:D-alanine-D-alanine ligase
MRIAVVRNRNRDGVINRLSAPCPEKYGKRTVQMVLDALRAGQHTVACLEGDKTLLAELERFMPSDEGHRPTGLVLNMAYGIQGEARYTHVPAMLEMAGVPYTGATPLGHAISLDKVTAKLILRQVGIPTPRFAVLTAGQELSQPLRYPLVVKPRRESTSYGLQLVRDAAELNHAVASVTVQYQQEALVEEYIDGREICVALLGNDSLAILPPLELDFSGREPPLMTWDDKYHRRMDEPRKICPAQMAAGERQRIEDIALTTFRACHARDYARVDIRIDAVGRPYVLEINSMASLGRGGSFVRAAEVAGYGFTALVNHIVDVAHERYYGSPALHDRSLSFDVMRTSTVLTGV